MRHDDLRSVADTEVANETGMLMPTIYRIAMTLEAEDFLDRLPDGRYRPASGSSASASPHRGAWTSSNSPAVPCRPLAEKAGEPVNLAAARLLGAGA